MTPRFGGQYTETKLNALVEYLNAYLTIMKANPRALFFKTRYVDGFAGSGKRYAKKSEEPSLFDDFGDEGTQAFFKGSAYRCLELDPPV